MRLPARPPALAAAGALALALALSGCGGDEPPVATAPVVAPGAPGETARTIAPGEPVPTVAEEVAAADVAFVTGMIPHHEQALVLADLAPERAGHRSVLGLADRISDVQTAEIGVYQRWLADRGLDESGEPVARRDAGHEGGHEGHGEGAHGEAMGMVSDADLARLRAASGTEFDRLWLRLMIAHHEGAVAMAQARDVDGGLDETARQMAADVTADQLAEIRRMQQVLGELG